MSGQREAAVGPIDLARRVRALVPSTYRRLAKLASVSFAGGLLEAALLVLLARIAVAAAEEPSRIEVPWADSTVSVAAGLSVALLLLAGKFAVGVLTARAAAAMAAAGLTDVRLSLLRSFLGARWPVQASERQGDLQELMTTHADRTTSVNLSLAALVTAGLNVVTLVAIALVVDLVAAVAIVATGAGLALGLRPLASAGRRNASRHADAGRSFASAVSQLVATARELRVGGVTEEALAEVEELHRRQARRYQRSRFLLLLSPQLYHASALLVLIAGIGVVSVTTATSIAGIGAVVLLLLRAFAYGQQAQTAYQALNDAVPYLDQLRVQRDRYLANPAASGATPVTSVGQIRLDDVRYEYVPGKPVLDGVTATVERGEAVGIIGPSGSGKSTLLQVLLRLREPTVGRLVVDGADAVDLDLDGWYGRIAFVPQNPQVIEGTVAENITFYRDLPRDAVQEAADLAHLTAEIAALPRGFDEVIGPEDTTLSGGQQQRLAIARALVGRPELLVLDEPTSALDMVSESRIQETLRSLHGRITLVVVAHRLSTINVCDRVMVLADGRVQGFDSHERLLASSAFYEETLRLSLMHQLPAAG